MNRYLVPLHPADLPHAETLGISPWVQWAVVAALAGVGGWLVVNAQLERRAQRREEQPSSPPLLPPIPTEGEGSPTACETTSPSPALPERGPGGEGQTPPSTRPQLVKRSTPKTPRPRLKSATQAASGTNPVQLFITVICVALGWAAIDRIRAVDAMGSFVRTDGAVQVGRVAFAFAALLWVGGALAPVAPRGSAVVLAIAGAIGTFLAVPDRWEVRLEWWGAGSVLSAWSSRPIWASAAFTLAISVVIAERFRPRRYR